MQAARVCGAGQLITVDVRPEASEISLALGADHAINAREDDPVEAIRDLTAARVQTWYSSAPAAASSRD